MSFSVKRYLIENELVDEYGSLICRAVTDSSAWGIGPHDRHETKIYLCTLVYFLEKNCLLDNLSISIDDGQNFTYMIYMSPKDPDVPMDFDWGIVVDTIEFLLQFMAGSNISYLSGMFFELDD